MFQDVSRQKVINLLVGILGVYSMYFMTSLWHQKMIKLPFKNIVTGGQQVFPYAVAFLIFPTGISWFTGFIINCFYNQHTYMPTKNLILSASMVATSTITYTIAIYYTNFPIVMIFKSCNVISVVLVALLCSRVRDKQLSLGFKKLITAFFITIGIIMYNFLGKDDIQTKKDTGDLKVGIPLLILSLFADGFLPDFQAEIKSVYKPRPIQMFQHINKWVCILSIIYSMVVNFQIVDIIQYMLIHPDLALYMLGMSVFSTIGQMFVYRLIKQFKQHVVPFLITIRKIVSVVLSIFVYNHSSTLLQNIGIFIVFSATCFEFYSEIKHDKNDHQKVAISDQQLNGSQPNLNLGQQENMIEQQDSK